MRRFAIAFPILLCTATLSFAHYSMLLPDKPWAEKGEKVTFTYQFGHPYEHELFDAPRPEALAVLSPKGEREFLDPYKVLTKYERPGADKKNVTAWRFEFTPKERGDYLFVLRTAPFKAEPEGEKMQDYVSVYLHVQTQNGWTTAKMFLKGGFGIQPFTRPYGILPGMAFRGRAFQLGGDNRNFDDMVIEVEKYNDKPVKNPPPDELITFKTKADHDGTFIATLPEAGWWGMTAPFPGKFADNIARRASLWVHVDEKK